MPTHPRHPRSRRVYVAIMRAAEEGRGVSLTAAEVRALSLDDAIATAAYNMLRPGEGWQPAGHFDWRTVTP